MFINQTEFLKFLTEQDEGEQIIALLGITTDTPFLAETVFLQGWNRELEGRPDANGMDDYEAYITPQATDDPDSPPCVQVYITYADEDFEDEIFMILTPDTTHPGQYGLQIIRNDNLIYERTAEHNPATEWLVNGMANDDNYQLEDGQIAFQGDMINI